MIKRILGVLFVLMSFATQAQEMTAVHEPEMADTFRADGKIYVVISVIALIFIALVSFLIYIERKLKNIEEKLK